MNSESPLIDFRELATIARGEGLEHLVREIGKRKGLSPTWSGRGADSGRDLLFTEVLSGPLSKEKISWLVSCKDKAVSKESVTEKDLPHPGVIDKLAQHKANGFLLVTTTTASTAAKSLLDSLDQSNGGAIHTLVWDSAELTAFLLDPKNQDLLKQFLPESYRRVKGLTSIEGALLAFRDQIPENVLFEVMRLVRPYAISSYEGFVIWPFDSATAMKIDQILEYVIIKPDFDKAIRATKKLQPEAFTALVQHLHKHYEEECFAYLSFIVIHLRSKVIKFNAAEFLFENYEVSPADLIRFASHLDRESLEDLYFAEVASFIEFEISVNSVDYEIHSSLDEMSSYTVISEVHFNWLKFDPIVDQQIRFVGQFFAHVDLEFEQEKMGTYILPGKCSGYFNEFGIFLEKATVDTSAFYA